VYLDWPELHREITDACHEIDQRLQFPNQRPPYNRMQHRPNKRAMAVSPLRVYFEVDEQAQIVKIVGYKMGFGIYRP